MARHAPANGNCWAERVDAANKVFGEAACGDLVALAAYLQLVDEARRTLEDAADMGEVARLFATAHGLLEDCCSTLLAR